MKNKIEVILGALAVMFMFSGKIQAQQEAQYSMYFFVPQQINPGYAGSQEALTVSGLIRDQWTNFDGAPKTQVLSVHSPLKNDHIGLGLIATNDKIGANKSTGTYADFAYRIRLNKKGHRLAFGLRAGLDYNRTDYTDIKIADNTDNLYIDNYNQSMALFNAGAGIYYYGERFFLGASSPKLVKNKLSNSSFEKSTQENHIYLFGGYVFRINSAVNMRPSFIVKYVNNAPLSIDGNLSFLFYDKVWVGGMYRYNSAVGVNLMYQISQNFRIGYAFDYTLNEIQRYSNGSHEIMLSFNLKSRSKGFKTPRYF